MIYLDSRALIKKYIVEKGTHDVRGFSASGELLWTSKISQAEVWSAFARRRRGGQHPRRASDAIQLASAVWAKQSLGEPLVFVGADEPLMRAAGAMALTVVNPETQPGASP